MNQTEHALREYIKTLDTGGGGLTIDDIYPVGSIYMSVNSANPETLFAGTEWERITGKFLLGATDTGASGGNSRADIVAGGTGGEASHKLTGAESGQKNLGNISVTGGSHTHAISGYKFLDTLATGGGVSRSNQLGTTGTKVNGVLTSPDAAVNRVDIPDSGSLTMSTTISASDASDFHNNMPPYLSVYIWKRTA